VVEQSESVVAQARDLMQQGQHREAVDLLSPWLADNPNDANGWATLGSAHFELENWPDAEKAARTVVRLRPKSAREWCNLGVILRKQDRVAEATEAQRKALVLDGGYRRAKLELNKLREDDAGDSESRGWKVRTPTGEFLGPVSKEELLALIVQADIEPHWSARRGNGAVTTVRDVLGVDLCFEALEARKHALEESVVAEGGTAERSDATDNHDPVLQAVRDASDGAETQFRSAKTITDQIRRAAPAAIVVLLVLVMTVRTGLIERGEATVRQEAMSAVLDLSDATSVGVVYVDYRRRVIDSRQAFRRARDRSVMQRGPVWAHLEDALGSYEEAADAWAKKIDIDSDYGELLYESEIQSAWEEAGFALVLAKSAMTSDMRVWPLIANVLGVPL